MPYTFCFWNSIQLSKPSRVYIHSFWNSALQTYKSITNSQNNKRLSWIYLQRKLPKFTTSRHHINRTAVCPIKKKLKKNQMLSKRAKQHTYHTPLFEIFIAPLTTGSAGAATALAAEIYSAEPLLTLILSISTFVSNPVSGRGFELVLGANSPAVALSLNVSPREATAFVEAVVYVPVCLSRS